MFSEALKALRTELGLTQQEMADRLNIDRSTYSRLEHKEHPPPYLLERINKEFGMDPWSWMKTDQPASTNDHHPRVVQLHRDEGADPSDEARWRVKAVDLLGRTTELLENMIRDPGRNKGGG